MYSAILMYEQPKKCERSQEYEPGPNTSGTPPNAEPPELGDASKDTAHGRNTRLVEVSFAIFTS